MENKTEISEFLLLWMSEIPLVQTFLFPLCSAIYATTLIGNLMIVSIIIIDVHLHTPMFFFLSNLACLDIASSSVTTPRLLYDFFRKKKTISIVMCLAQLYFFLTFISTETFLLAAMSYDRYTAICLPLRYTNIMHWSVCFQVIGIVWAIGIVYALLYTLCTLNLSFCGPNIIQNFFCDLRQLLQISCSDNSINLLLIFLIGGVLGLTAFLITFLPYIKILATVLRITSNEGRQKAFSTCISHLTVVLIFYSTSAINYFHPNSKNFYIGQYVSVIYAVVVPVLNPLVYSLRNNELKLAFRKCFKILLN